MANTKKASAATWQQAMRRRIQGEKHEFEALPGYWFKPRKYSVCGEREIQSAAFGASAAAIPRHLLKRFRELSKEREELEFNDIVDHLTEDELFDLVESQSTGDADSTEVIKLQLLYGWGEHNFEDTNAEGATENFVEQILEFKELAMEAIGVIQEHNRPLAERTSDESETPSSTSTTE